MLVVLIGAILVIGDQVAKANAQNPIAQQDPDVVGRHAKPSVSIEGLPFLTQVAAHDVKAIDISASNVKAGKFDISSVKARATGVHLNSSFSGATIDQINGTATISYRSRPTTRERDRPAGSLRRSITADPADGPNAVKVGLQRLASVTRHRQADRPNQITIHFGQLGGIASLLGGVLRSRPRPSRSRRCPRGSSSGPSR